MRTARFICVCFNSVFCVAICGGHFALSGHHLGRPAAILLELDFLSLCLETRALRNTYLTLRKKEKKRLEARSCTVSV